MANTNLDKYVSLKKRVETAQQKVDQADGALGEVMKQLKNEFDCDSLGEAKKELKSLKTQEISSKTKFENAVEKFEEDWEEEIED